MGNENHHHHDFYHQSLHIHHRSTYLPMLCSRTSIKSVSLPQRRNHHPGSFSNNPLSPRIGCMGQVKRDNKIAQLPTSQHRLSFNTPKSNTTSISISPIVKYSKLKKLFSAKNLTTTTTAPSYSCGRRQQVTRVLKSGCGCGGGCCCVAELQTNVAGIQNQVRCSRNSGCGPQFKSLMTAVSGADVPRKRNQRCGRNENVAPISIENMDPPLPVIKGGRKSEEVNSLWKRRSGGAALKSLKLPQVHHPRHHLQLTSV